MISIVIPTRNRKKDLQECLLSIAKMDGVDVDYEVIVVDNGSSDGTNKLCEEFEKKINNFRYFYDEHPGLHVGRNIGFEQSEGEIVAYLDDDVIVSDTWLKGLAQAFETSMNIVLVGGNNIPLFEGKKPYWIRGLYRRGNQNRILEDYSCIEFKGKARDINPFFVFGCNFAIRRNILLETKGFCPDGMPDNYLYYRGNGESYVSKYVQEKKGYIAWFSPDATVYHKVPKERLTHEYVRKIAYRSGISYSYSKLREKEEAELLEFIKRGVPKRGVWQTQLNYQKKVAFFEGVLFHYNRYCTDNSIREWVHREDYLGQNKYF